MEFKLKRKVISSIPKQNTKATTVATDKTKTKEGELLLKRKMHRVDSGRKKHFPLSGLIYSLSAFLLELAKKKNKNAIKGF